MSKDGSDLVSDVCELMRERSRRRRTEHSQPVGICRYSNLREHPDNGQPGPAGQPPTASSRHHVVDVSPGATRYISGEVANAFGGHVIGSTAIPALCPTRPGQSEVHTCTHGVSAENTTRTPSPC